MKKKILKLILLASTILILTNCKKYGKDHESYFYTDIDSSSVPLTLFIDGENKGVLPNFQTSNFPSNDTILNNALKLSLKSGKYKIEAKDYLGNIKCSGVMKFRSNKISAINTIGAYSLANNGSKIVVELNIETP